MSVRTRRRRRLQKFPLILEYANAKTRFAVETPANIDWAWQLYNGLIPWGVETLGRRANYERVGVWRKFRSEWLVFREFLECVRQRLPAPELMDAINEHCKHVEERSGWVDSSDDPAWEMLKSGASHDDYEDYYEYWEPQDPLDPLYWQFREWLRQYRYEFLRKCPQCHRYFMQPTARQQIYCQDACRRQHYRADKSANAEDMRHYREGKTRKLLRKVKALKEELKKDFKGESLRTKILETLGITIQKWWALKRFERDHKATDKATDLPSS
jgi:hypothetical protein